MRLISACLRADSECGQSEGKAGRRYVVYSVMLETRQQRLPEWPLITLSKLRESDLECCNDSGLASAGRALDDGDVGSVQRNIERKFLGRCWGSSERAF
jgi:hypothetical protein